MSVRSDIEKLINRRGGMQMQDIARELPQHDWAALREAVDALVETSVLDVDQRGFARYLVPGSEPRLSARREPGDE